MKVSLAGGFITMNNNKSNDEVLSNLKDEIKNLNSQLEEKNFIIERTKEYLFILENKNEIISELIQEKDKEIESLKIEHENALNKLKEEKISSNSIDMSSLKSTKVGSSNVLIPEGYKLQTTRPNGALFYNGKTAMGIFELPRRGSGLNAYYENSIKQWDEEFGHTETTTFILNNTILKSVTVNNEQKRMKKTYFKKNGIEYHIFENGIGDKNAFDVLFNSVVFDFENSLWSKLKNIPQLSHTSWGYSTENGKIRYHNWVGASFYPTLIDDFDGFCEREWFTRYLNNKFPNEDFKINFFGVFGTHHTLKYPMDGKKVLYSLENLTYRVSEMREEFDTYALDYVDLAMGYDLVNDKKYFRFPFWARAHFSPEVTEEEIENTVDNWNSLCYEKTRDVINISSHDRWNLRKKIADDVEKIVEITYGGKWRNNTEELWTKYGNNKEKFMNSFKFNLCAENLDDTGYVTEKIFDSIKSDCIPLYVGGGDYLEPEILNPNAILRWFMEDTIDNADTVELFKNIYSDEKTYNEFKDQDILLDSTKKYIINLFSDLEKHFERLIYE